MVVSFSVACCTQRICLLNKVPTHTNCILYIHVHIDVSIIPCCAFYSINLRFVVMLGAFISSTQRRKIHLMTCQKALLFPEVVTTLLLVRCAQGDYYHVHNFTLETIHIVIYDTLTLRASNACIRDPLKRHILFDLIFLI